MISSEQTPEASVHRRLHQITVRQCLPAAIPRSVAVDSQTGQDGCEMHVHVGRQAATWKEPASSDATFKTSGKASDGKAESNESLISSRDIPAARHSRIKETASRVPRTASFPPRSCGSATIH